MRLSRRLPIPHLRSMLFFILLAAAVASHAQTSGQLPQKWDEAVRALAENIAAAARPARTISLDVKNISSLASTDAGVVQQALESDLTHRGFHFDAASSAEARVEVTLSEAAEKYVWVAETHVGDADRVAIFDVVRTPDFSTQKEVDSVVLDRKLVWQQPGKILDFAVFQVKDSANSILWVLEPDRALIYRNAGDQWQFDAAMAITHRAPWPRDLRGAIDAQHASVVLPGVECALKSAPQNELQCSAAQAGKSGPTIVDSPKVDSPQIRIEGREGGDNLSLGSMCGANSVVVGTGTGDWTQPDSIQAYLEKDERAAPSGEPIQTGGPITALHWASEGEARVVVHNLKTGNYEAYFVTATCSH
jgi:hypothetical protein